MSTIINMKNALSNTAVRSNIQQGPANAKKSFEQVDYTDTDEHDNGLLFPPD